MAGTKQATDSKRRKPKQERAHETIEVIFEATARILQKEGRAALNTNRIAECAGMSVATLYQYFPNKVAILVEMARKEVERATAAVLKAMEDETSGDPVRTVVRALISEFGRRRKARRMAFQALIAEGHVMELEQNMDGIAQALIASGRNAVTGQDCPLSPVTVFILIRAVNGVLVSASNESSAYLDTQEFEDELVRLVRGFLAAVPA